VQVRVRDETIRWVARISTRRRTRQRDVRRLSVEFPFNVTYVTIFV
jgi:hypothetical protein